MNTLGRQQKTLLAVFLLLLALVLLNPFSSSIRGAVFQALFPIQSFAWNLPSLVRFGSQEETNLLREQNRELRQQLAELEDAALENNELRAALGFREQEGFRLIGAEISGKMVGEDRIFLKVADDARIQEGMPIVSSGGLAVGRIEKVLGATLQVILLSHTESSVDAKIPGSPGAALLRGQGGGRVALDLIPHQMNIVEGDSVATSTLGGLFPENLLIGTVGKVEKKDTDSFQQAEILPFFSLSEHEVLFVITNFSTQ